MTPERGAFLRRRFLIALFLSSALTLVGAAFLFSLSSGFIWWVLVLGCLSIIGGPAILLLSFLSLEKKALK